MAVFHWWEFNSTNYTTDTGSLYNANAHFWSAPQPVRHAAPEPRSKRVRDRRQLQNARKQTLRREQRALRR